MLLSSNYIKGYYMRVVTIGTGCAALTLKRGGPCVLIEAGGMTLLFDLGVGSLHGLLKEGINHKSIDGLFLTHIHPDHISEVIPFLFAANYDEEPRTKPLVIGGSPEVGELINKLSATFNSWLDPKNYGRELVSMKEGVKIRVGGVEIMRGPAAHHSSSLSFKVSHGGRAIVIAGDTGPCPALATFAKGVDLLIIEASLLAGEENEYHLTAAEAGNIAREAGVKTLLLTHFYPSSELEDPAQRLKTGFSGETLIATDGLELLFS
jgi:ribonuclease BN (tRNA processing enzyme)